ncbi:5'/3'-nucleotidase SurE [candidate division KSB1 bacterium]|nr:5'/3'-nucleotidase SurE [candidate division KSB1 bacterium]
MKILLTNDDGIHAPGIAALFTEMSKLGEVFVVAPDRERSASAHAITLMTPLRVKHIEQNEHFAGYAINGMPADCVKVAYWALGIRPDIIISGINLGSNSGINLLYSGTVSAAAEGIFVNVPSFAISLATFTNPDFGPAARFARKLTSLILQNGLPRGTILNVNVPAVPENELTGVQVTQMGQAYYQENYDKRDDPHNHTYYWLTGNKVDVEMDDTVDDRALMNNKISITPIQFDLTNYSFMDQLNKWKFQNDK